jgi:hypothetical protein
VARVGGSCCCSSFECRQGDFALLQELLLTISDRLSFELERSRLRVPGDLSQCARAVLGSVLLQFISSRQQLLTEAALGASPRPFYCCMADFRAFERLMPRAPDRRGYLGAHLDALRAAHAQEAAVRDGMDGFPALPFRWEPVQRCLLSAAEHSCLCPPRTGRIMYSLS